MIGRDHDRDQRIIQRFVNVGHVFGVLGEPVTGGDDSESDLMGGYVVE